MELHIKDRILIPSLLPEKNNFMEFNLKKSIIQKIGLTNNDRKEYEIVEKQEEQRIEWNVQKDIEVPLIVEFSKDELNYLKKACESVSDRQMPDELWAVVERIYNAAQD